MADRRIQECVEAVLEGKDAGPATEVIKDELLRAAVRQLLEEKKSKGNWKMVMRNVVHNGCLLNGNASG